MTATYEKIATTTLGSAAATVTFSSISGAYTDLVLVVNYGGSVSDTAAFMQFNGNTGSNYSNTKILGDGSVSVSQRNSNLTYAIISDNITSTTLTMNCIVSIQNYSNTTTYKTSLGRYNLASGITEAIVNLWRNTSAITQIVLDINAGNFITGSTFTIYGIKAE